MKACYFQPCPTNNLGNLLQTHFSTVQHIQTNEISPKSGRLELVSALLLQISWKKEAGQRRNLPKCPNSRKDYHQGKTIMKNTHLSRKGHPVLEVSGRKAVYMSQPQKSIIYSLHPTVSYKALENYFFFFPIHKKLLIFMNGTL